MQGFLRLQKKLSCSQKKPSNLQPSYTTNVLHNQKKSIYIHLIHSPSHFWLIPIGQYQQYKIYISDHKSPERGRLIPPGTSLSEYLMNTWWKANSKSMCRWSHMLTCSYLSSWISYYSYTSIKASAQTVSWHAGEFQLGVSSQAGNVSHSRPCHTAIWSTA